MRTEPNMVRGTLDAMSSNPAVAAADTAAALSSTFAGLDALDLGIDEGPGRARKLWSMTWPKLAAVAIAIGLWQLVYVSEWKPHYALQGPEATFKELWHMTEDGIVATAIRITMLRALKGFLLATIIGVAIGSLVAQFKLLRNAVGSMITGIMTMPSIAWFPLAIMLFKISEGAIMFVVVLGAAPAIANSLITGVDHIPPILRRAGRVLGAKGFAEYRHVILPASMPSFVGGLKQGWAFAWRSLMAGELIVIIRGQASIGQVMQVNRDLTNSAGVLATIIIILVIGVLVDALVFGRLDKWVRRRWGLVDHAAK